MATQNIRLIGMEDVADGTTAFHFEKPDGFEYRAGQYGDFTLIDPPETDEKGNSRTFTLASAPFEDDLMLTTRMRDSAFKRVLKQSPAGSELKFDAPHGSFVLHKNSEKPAVYLTGGIGVTPARSIIAEASNAHLPHTITLFYSNKTPDDAAFLDQFQELERKNENFTFVPVMTRSSADDWNGERGHIDTEMLKKYVPDLTSPIYYLSGPADMVATMRDILLEAEVDEDNIRTEEFPGY